MNDVVAAAAGLCYHPFTLMATCQAQLQMALDNSTEQMAELVCALTESGAEYG